MIRLKLLYLPDVQSKKYYLPDDAYAFMLVSVDRGRQTPEIRRRKQRLIFAVEGCAWCLSRAHPTSPTRMASGPHLILGETNQC